MDYKIRILLLYFMVGLGASTHSKPVELTPHLTVVPLQVVDDREKVECEFDEPITIVVSVLHYYDSYEELNHDYQVWGVGVGEVWGWSTCEWQPENNYAACDIYTVHPVYIHADMAMDTIGHEVYHGSCGGYHYE